VSKLPLKEKLWDEEVAVIVTLLNVNEDGEPVTDGGGDQVNAVPLAGIAHVTLKKEFAVVEVSNGKVCQSETLLFEIPITAPAPGVTANGP